jgi:hypothetical protein
LQQKQQQLLQHPQQHEPRDTWPAAVPATSTASLHLLCEAFQMSQSKDDIIETIFESPLIVLSEDFLLSSGDERDSAEGGRGRAGASKAKGERVDSGGDAQGDEDDDDNDDDGGDSRKTPGQHEVDDFAARAVHAAALRQEAKDIQRDRIHVNGTSISDGGRTYEEIVVAFTDVLRSLLQRSPYGQAAVAAGEGKDEREGGAEVARQQLHALCRALAMVLLHAGNRTQSGGVSFAQVLRIFTTPTSIIAPVSDRADPLEYTITLGEFQREGLRRRRRRRRRSSAVLHTSPARHEHDDVDDQNDGGGGDGGDGGGDGVRRWGLRCHLRANSYFRLCESNPADDRSSTWAVVKAQYDVLIGQDLMPSAVARYRSQWHHHHHHQKQQQQQQQCASSATTGGEASAFRGSSAGGLGCDAMAVQRGTHHLQRSITVTVRAYTCMASAGASAGCQPGVWLWQHGFWS